MGEWPVQCFKAYDIRGLANGDGSEMSTVRLSLAAIAKYLGCKQFAVGRDIRDSSPALTAELILGLTDSGVSVLDLELCPQVVSTMHVGHYRLKADDGYC